MQLNHILVTTDLSLESLRPLQEAAELARTNGARLTMLTVVHQVEGAPTNSPYAPEMTDPDIEPRLEAAREAMRELTSDVHGLDIEVVAIPAQKVPAAVERYAVEHDVDLLAISTHGRSGWRRLALGSVAEAIVRHSSVPVLVFQRPKA